MKSATLPSNFPANPEDWERLIAEAPGVDRPPTQEETAARANAIVSHSLPELMEKLAARRRGKGRAPLKVPTTIRLEPETLERWRASGKGWQTRAAEVLAKAAPG